MKKILSIFCLLTIACVGVSHAGLITYSPLSGDSGFSYQFINNSFSTIYDEFNGAVEGGVNIEPDSLVEEDMSDAINPRIRTDEITGSYTVTGMLPATATGLTSNISAGTSYVEGFRVVTDTTSKTYTLSKDTWLYIDQNGAFQTVETALGAEQPTSPTNSLLLAKVTTDGSDITTVSDERTTAPPGQRTYQDYVNGCVISRDVSDTDVVNVQRGEIDFGASVTSGLRRNIADIDIDFSTNGRGGLDTGSLAKGYYYIYVVADDDNSTNFEGIASTDGDGDITAVTGERLVGWCYAPSGSAISPDSIGTYKGRGASSPNITRNKISPDAGTTIDIQSDTYKSLMMSKFYSSGRSVSLSFTGPFERSSEGRISARLLFDGVEVNSVKDKVEGSGDECVISLSGVVKPDEGEYECLVQVRDGDASSGTVSLANGSGFLIIEEL